MPRVCYVYCFYSRVCQMVFRPWSQEMSAKWCKCIGEIYVSMSLVESTWRPRRSQETLQIKSHYLPKRDSSVYVCYYNHTAVTIWWLKMGGEQLWCNCGLWGRKCSLLHTLWSMKFTPLILKISVLTSHKTHCVSITKTNCQCYRLCGNDRCWFYDSDETRDYIMWKTFQVDKLWQAMHVATNLL